MFGNLRRRLAGTLPLDDQTEKGPGKNRQSRFCLLASLAALFWFLLLYFHFVVLGGSSTVTQLNPVSLNTKSITTRPNNPNPIPVNRHIATTRPTRKKWKPEYCEIEQCETSACE
ncbi:Xyloglucan galactosyltransferase KATAMARI1 [Abeliophyllum distichum]|uniref:Xyloglucan galactosyltransferase KATAMARI1 n=1 Tax=Abeliophyllum distichum TaxID=126358 RepID=A0ABD1VTP1_9LAMI